MKKDETNPGTAAEGAAQPDNEATEAQAPASEAKLSAVPDPLEEWKNRAVYLSAEIENMRKRFAREKSDVIRYANEELLKSLLPVLDNLLLALKAMKDAEARSPEVKMDSNSLVAKLLQGVDMTAKHFEQTLERMGVQPVVSVGQIFDPEKHEAIAQSEHADRKEGEVTAELQRGYTLNGRLIRSARVVVNKATQTGQVTQ